MKKLWIIGDSFSSNMSQESWVHQFSKTFTVINLSKNGVSQYRLYRIFLDCRDNIKPEDIVIFCHTNPYRIFIPNHINYPTRDKDTHKECDLVLGDIDRHGIIWKFISYIFFKYFYDKEYYETLFNLIVEDMNRLNGCKIINISGFDTTDNILSIKDIYEMHKGNINHLSIEGNRLVAERILKFL